MTRQAREVSDGQKGDHKFKFGRPKPRPETGKDRPVSDNSKCNTSEPAQNPEVKAGPQKKLETTRPFVWYNCHKPGHIAAQCGKAKVVFLSVGCHGENMKFLEPYMRDLQENGKPCRLLRDSAATMDVVHNPYVEPEMFTGECASIMEAIEAHSASLPVAKVSVKGPFGTLEWEAAVSPTVLPSTLTCSQIDRIRFGAREG